MYNSANLNQDDPDMTIINHSFLYGYNDTPVSTYLPIFKRSQINQSSNNEKNIDRKEDCIFVNRDPLDSAKQIEQILIYYRQELKQESNTQLNCNQQLIIRLIDFIRLIYSSSNHKQMNDLDILYEDISNLHNQRFIEQKEKNDRLHNHIQYLKKSLISTSIDDENQNNLITDFHRINSIVDYEQWTEMEEETKKLQNLVQIQYDRIKQLTDILSNADIINNNNQHTTANLLSTSTRELKNNRIKKCTICNYEFPLTYNDIQINNHLERCTSTPIINDINISMESKFVECPYCYKKFSNNDHTAVQHVSECYNKTTVKF